MKWFIPSWNGDLRLVPDTDPSKTRITIENPTLDEQRIVNLIGKQCVEQGWLDTWSEFEGGDKVIVVGAPIEKVGPLASMIMRPGPAVMTALKFSGGEIIATSAGPEALKQVVEAVAAPDIKPKDKPQVAATVKRHTPCCPNCIPGSIGPATEVLLSFLTDEQHASWAKDRTLIVEGHLSGSRYRLAHRNSLAARQVGRICYDIDSRCVVHFHDWTVPPEEEVLAAKLILEHREPWLRNEATMFDRRNPDVMVFKNPFGDLYDGTQDAGLARGVGMVLRALTPLPKAT